MSLLTTTDQKVLDSAHRLMEGECTCKVFTYRSEDIPLCKGETDVKVCFYPVGGWVGGWVGGADAWAGLNVCVCVCVCALGH